MQGQEIGLWHAGHSSVVCDLFFAAACRRSPRLHSADRASRALLVAARILLLVDSAINRAMLRAELAWRESLRTATVADLRVQARAGMGKQRLRLATAWLRDKVRL